MTQRHVNTVNTTFLVFVPRLQLDLPNSVYLRHQIRKQMQVLKLHQVFFLLPYWVQLVFEVNTTVAWFWLWNKASENFHFHSLGFDDLKQQIQVSSQNWICLTKRLFVVREQLQQYCYLYDALNAVSSAQIMLIKWKLWVLIMRGFNTLNPSGYWTYY